MRTVSTTRMRRMTTTSTSATWKQARQARGRPSLSSHDPLLLLFYSDEDDVPCRRSPIPSHPLPQALSDPGRCHRDFDPSGMRSQGTLCGGTGMCLVRPSPHFLCSLHSVSFHPGSNSRTQRWAHKMPCKQVHGSWGATDSRASPSTETVRCGWATS
jgi:hypothetical protein